MMATDNKRYFVDATGKRQRLSSVRFELEKGVKIPFKAEEISYPAKIYSHLEGVMYKTRVGVQAIMRTMAVCDSFVILSGHWNNQTLMTLRQNSLLVGIRLCYFQEKEGDVRVWRINNDGSVPCQDEAPTPKIADRGWTPEVSGDSTDAPDIVSQIISKEASLHGNRNQRVVLYEDTDLLESDAAVRAESFRKGAMFVLNMMGNLGKKLAE